MKNGVILVRIVHKIALGEVHTYINRVGVLLSPDAMGEDRRQTKLNLVSHILVVKILHNHRLL